MNDIERIKSKLSDQHIELCAPVDISDIRSFEKTYQISLPQELVDFYTLISNGCQMIDEFQLYPFEKWKFDPERINKPFEFKDYWIWESESEPSHDFKEIENGIIELIDIGDAQSWNIVVEGNKRGEMWFYTDVGIQSACPSMSFLKWYEYWLDGGTDYFYEFQYNYITIKRWEERPKKMIIYDIDTTENGYSKLEGEVQSISELKSLLATNDRIVDCTGYLTIEGLKRNSICIAALSGFGVSIAITDAEGVHLTLQDADKLTEVVDVWGDGLDISIGLFIPEKLAWQVLAEYINDRTFSKETQWIMSADIPEGGNYIC